MKDTFEDGKIFVGGLSQDTTKESMRRHFAEFGNITDCVVMLDKGTNRSRGFGFVTFDNTEAIDTVLATKQVLDGKEVDCKRACPRETMNQNNLDNRMGHVLNKTVHTDKIFVGGLPDISTDEFKAYFEKFGKVTDAVLMTDKANNRPRGFGFITYENPEAVEEVVKQYNSHHLNGKWVEVKKATPKDQMAKGPRDLAPGGMYGGYPSFNKWGYNGYSMDRGGSMHSSVYGGGFYYDHYHDGYGDHPKHRYDSHGYFSRTNYSNDYPPGAYSGTSPYNTSGGSRGPYGGHPTYEGSMSSSNMPYGQYSQNQYPAVYPNHGPQRGNRSNILGRSFPY